MILLNGKKITPTIFPDKTSQVWKLDEIRYYDNIITWVFENEAEFLHLAQLKDLILDASLCIKYLPYARQDKEITNNTTFALRTFSKLLNSLNFKKVIIIDVHSDIALYLIDNSITKLPSNFYKIVDKYKNICYPDKGASGRYDIKRENKIIGNKTRDQLTGYITNYTISGDVKNKNILIVDDICDGGMTFILLVKKLIENGANRVDLYVSHGLFTKGTQCLYDAGITNIYMGDM